VARKTKEDTEKTYHALLDAASRLFIRQGVARTTLKDIAEEAGMTRGAVYWHFDDKDAVIKALWERNARAGHDAFIEQLQQIDRHNASGHFRQLIRDIVRTVVNDHELSTVLRIIIHNVEFTDDKSELQQFLMEKKGILFDAMVTAFQQLINQHAVKVDMTAELLAHGLIAYIHGLIEIYLKPGPQSLDLGRHSDELVNMFLNSMLVD